MSGKMTVAVHDDVHHQPAEGIEYDLWRLNQPNDRVKLRHDQITSQHPHVLVQASTPDELGSFELVLFVKDYFEHQDRNIQVQSSRIIIPFGINQIDRDYHLNISITPTSFTCTL